MGGQSGGDIHCEGSSNANLSGDVKQKINLKEADLPSFTILSLVAIALATEAIHYRVT